jgi:AcrR family transcriptional regulator
VPPSSDNAPDVTVTTPNPAPAAPRRRDAAVTRERLMESGRRAFAQKGLAGAILIEDILRPAGVSTGSFYHQFRDKNALLLAILDDHAQAFRARVVRTLEHPSDAGPTRFVDLARACFSLALELADEHGELLRIERRERDNDDPAIARYMRESQESWIEQVAGYLSRGSVDDSSEADCRLAAQFVIDLGLTSVAHYQDLAESERPLARERLIDSLVRFTMGGLPGLTRERQNPSSLPNSKSTSGSTPTSDQESTS